MSDDQHACSMFCDCPTARLVAGGTAAVRAGEPTGNGPSSTREAVNRAENTHRAATRWGGRR